MAYYSYKRVRDKLIAKGILDECGEPVDTVKYEDSDPNYNGGQWDMAADYIAKLEKAVRTLSSEPHETVVQRIYFEIFPDEVEAERKAIQEFNTQK